jgi:hypothetical protein
MSDKWKVRSVKPYANASNHLFIGEVLDVNDTYIRMNCRTFHFRDSVANGPKDVQMGDIAERIIPWSRVEVINVLPGGVGFRKKSDDRGPGIGL